MELLFARHTALWRVTLGCAFTSLTLLFIGIGLLIFPYKVNAIASGSNEFVYEVLGSLDYQANGLFTPVQDTALQNKLQHIIKEQHLNGIDAEAYILNRQTHTIVWQSAPATHLLNTSELVTTYDLAQLTLDGYDVVVQNFWLTHQEVRHEFQLVIAKIAIT